MNTFLGKSATGLFASRTISGHLVRGMVALVLLYSAIRQQHAHPVGALLAGLMAVVAMRGCPMCWTIGLVESIQQRLSRPGSAKPGG
jgi:nicotinamide riboside transporter PnuC